MPAIDLRFVATQPASLDLRFGNVWGGAVDYIDVTLSAVLPHVTFLAGLAAEQDNAVSRSPKLWLASNWQSGEPRSAAAVAMLSMPGKAEARVPTSLVEGIPFLLSKSAEWRQLRLDESSLAGAWSEAYLLPGSSKVLWRNLNTHQRPELIAASNTGASLASRASAPWISLLRHRRPSPVEGWRETSSSSRWSRHNYSQGRRQAQDRWLLWGEGALPGPGISPHAGSTVTPPSPCYSPPLGNAVALLFSGQQPAALNLFFRCPNAGPPSGPVATVIVPVRSIYMQTNTVTLELAESGLPIPVRGGLRLSLDADSWAWGWSASVPASYLSALSAPLGELVEVLATVNGTLFRLAVERINRDRHFAQATLSVSGRGRAAWLDDPFAPIISRNNTESMTAQQLMADALTENGVSIGWSIDWQISDWLVPSGVWNHTGTSMEACLRIAEAAGAYIQAHRINQTLSVLPRYPAAPWNWSGLTPDMQLPEDVCVTEGIEWIEKPIYNTVFVSGQTGGICAHVTRGGTAGDKAAPSITDALITHADAGAQRGTRILSDTGRQKLISLSLPVLAETGIITPGKLVRYSENGIHHLGLTRAVDVSADLPKLRQTIKIESYVL